MPASRSSIILIDEYVIKYNTIRNALIRDKALETVKLWDEVGTYVLKVRQSLINELKLGKDGVMNRLDVAVLAAHERYGNQSRKMSDITTHVKNIWSAKTVNEARKIAFSCGWDEDKFQAIIKKRPGHYNPYEVEQFKVVSKQSDYRPPVIEDEEQDDNGTIDSENSNNSNIDPELQRLLDGGSSK